MQRPLRIGIAGLGTVGTGVLDALRLHGAMIAARAGRPVMLAGVSARSRNKRRGEHDLARVAWHEDPVALARSPEIDVFVELMGGEGDPRQGGGRGGAQGRQAGRHRQQGAARPSRAATGAARRGAGRRARLRGGGGRRHPDRQDHA